MRPGDWTCPSCGANVFASKNSCYRCQTPKPDGGAGAGPEQGGQQPYGQQPYGGGQDYQPYGGQPAYDNQQPYGGQSYGQPQGGGGGYY